MNLLSYTEGSVFTGAEIKNWAKATINKNTNKTKRDIALWVLSHYSNLKDDHKYSMRMGYRSDNTSQTKVPLFLTLKINML